MSVTVDDRPLPADELGLRTVGEVLAHIQRDNRLVVHVLLDGEEPDLAHLPRVRQTSLAGHTLFIETAEPRAMALEVLAEVENQLAGADALKNEAAELLQKNLHPKAMEKLSGCFTVWHHAQESILKTAQLLRIDLQALRVGERSLQDVLGDFGNILRDIRESLENRDFVKLSDILMYETSQITAQWRAALGALRGVIAP